MSHTLAGQSLAAKVLARAEERAQAEDDVVGLHFLYQEMIPLHRKWQDHFLDAVDLIFGACHKQVTISAVVAQAFRDLRPQEALPAHLGFQTQAVLLEKEGSLAKAVEICKKAREQGWSGNWTWKTGCLAKSQDERGCGVTYISRSGIWPV